MGSLVRISYTKLNKRTNKRVRKFSKKWYIQFKKNGEYVREPAYTDKAASLAMLARRITEVERECEGIFDHFQQHLAAPITEHISAFRKHLADKGNTESHCKVTENRVRWILTTAGVTSIAALTKSRVDAALAKLTTDGASVSSRNHYLTAIKGFAKWLVDERRSPDNVIAGMHKKNTAGEETKERRPLTDQEFAKLLKATAKQPPWEDGGCIITGPDRAAAYLLAAYTGYRRKELSALTPKSFHLTGAEPYVELPARKSKRRKLERQPLRADVAEFFRKWLAGKGENARLWPLELMRTAEMIQADLVAAGVAHTVDGTVVDFHSLRATFTTLMVKAGVLPKVAQKLSRHSTIDLTMNTYTKLVGADERAGVEMMPAPKGLAQGLAQGRSTSVNASQRPLTPKQRSSRPKKKTDEAPQPVNQGIKKARPRKSGPR